MDQILVTTSDGKQRIESVQEYETKIKDLEGVKDLPGVFFFVQEEKKSDKNS